MGFDPIPWPRIDLEPEQSSQGHEDWSQMARDQARSIRLSPGIWLDALSVEFARLETESRPAGRQGPSIMEISQRQRESSYDPKVLVG